MPAAKDVPVLGTQDPAEKVFTKEDFLRIAGRIGEADRFAQFDQALAVGKILVDEVWGGSFELMNKRNTGHLAMDGIVDALHKINFTWWNRTRLTRCAELQEQDVNLGGVRQFNNLLPSHLYVVQGLDWNLQTALLRAANEQAMSVRALHEEVLKAKHQQAPEPKKEKMLLNDTYHAVERLRRAMFDHDHWWVDLNGGGVLQSFTDEFDKRFDQFSVVLEDLVVLMGNSGASVPAAELEELRERQAKRLKPFVDQVLREGNATPEEGSEAGAKDAAPQSGG
jgi:hypothetical protein